RAGLVGTHEPTISDYIGGQDGSQTAFHGGLGDSPECVFVSASIGQDSATLRRTFKEFRKPQAPATTRSRSRPR
ncbi:MAG: hypothetical protein ABI839_08060, partial [Verrucomicrobiota bacterium]